MTQYGTLLSDIPWQYSDKLEDMASTGLGASMQYDCMSIDTASAFLRSESIALADNAHSWMWFTNSFAEAAHDITRDWGFEPKTIVTWVKGRIENGRLVQHIGQGRYLRNSTEHLLFGVRGKCPPLVRYLPTSFIYPGRWPGRLHSEKPPIHQWCELMSPSKERLELFARRTRPGWECRGNQAGVLDG